MGDSLQQGITLLKEGKYAEAAGLLQEYLQEDENNPKAWNALGIVCSKSGEYEDAATCFENALTCDPDNPVYLKNLQKNQLKINGTGIQSEKTKKPDKGSLSRQILSSPLLSNPRVVYPGVIIVVLVVAVIVFMGLGGFLGNNSGSDKSASIQTQPTPVVTTLPEEASEQTNDDDKTSELKEKVAALFNQGKYEEVIVLIDERTE